MSIPLDRNQISQFTPAPLLDMGAAPVFSFRPVTERDIRAFWEECAVQGYKQHTDAVLREAIKAGMAELWDPESLVAKQTMLQAFWDAVDHNANNPEDQVAIDPADSKAVTALVEAVADRSLPLRRLLMDNRRFEADVPKLAIGFFCVGWRNVETPFRRAEGIIPLTTVDELEKELNRLDGELAAPPAKQKPPQAGSFIHLAMHAFDLMQLTAAELGNSEPLSASGPTPNVSSPAFRPQQTAAGGSRGLARSRKTRA